MQCYQKGERPEGVIVRPREKKTREMSVRRHSHFDVIKAIENQLDAMYSELPIPSIPCQISNTLEMDFAHTHTRTRCQLVVLLPITKYDSILSFVSSHSVVMPNKQRTKNAHKNIDNCECSNLSRLVCRHLNGQLTPLIDHKSRLTSI